MNDTFPGLAEGAPRSIAESFAPPRARWGGSYHSQASHQNFVSFGAVSLLAGLLGCEPEPSPPPPLPPLVAVAPPAGEAAPDPATTVLTMPPSSGMQCRDDSDCPPNGSLVGHCLCTMPIPDGPIETTGLCWNGRIKPKAWWCTVQDGHAFLHGLFVQE